MTKGSINIGLAKETRSSTFRLFEDKLRQLPAPPKLTRWSSLNATVVCACAATRSSDCDHINCPFHVVFLGSRFYPDAKFAYLYSSEADAWSEPTSAPCFGEIKEQKLQVPHLGNFLYFLLMARILEYNLVTRELTVIDPPAMHHDSVVFSDAVEGGRLGCVMRAGYNLHLWSREAVGPDGEMGWVESRVIEMATASPLSTVIPKIICYRDASGLIYDGTKYGFFATDLKVEHTRLLQEVRSSEVCFISV
ncbi:hypothetical protein EJB05_14802, partial [Eragrostis curvula]